MGLNLVSLLGICGRVDFPKVIVYVREFLGQDLISYGSYEIQTCLGNMNVLINYSLSTVNYTYSDGNLVLSKSLDVFGWKACFHIFIWLILKEIRNTNINMAKLYIIDNV